MKRIFISTLLISLIGLLSLTAQQRIYTPELSRPVNEAVGQAPDVVLDWNAVTGGNTGIIQYDVQYDTDPAFPNPVNIQTEFLTGATTSNLQFGQLYYWRVRAKDGGDVSGWSETWSFRVISRPTLKEPNDVSLQNDTVRIKWYAITGVTQFDYQFDTVYPWKQLTTGQTVHFFGAASVDETHSWIVGAGGLILFYDGTTLVEQESNVTTDLYGVHFLDANNGWAVGKGGKILHYDGTAWTQQTSGVSLDLTAVYMLDANHGYATAKSANNNSGTVLFYNGAAWSSVHTTNKDLTGVFAFDASHVWAVGKYGTIVHYNGTSWTSQEAGTVKDFSGVGFTSPDEGWAVGKTGFINHYKNGVWSQYMQDLTIKDLNGICFTGPDNGYIIGKSGTVLQFDGAEWYLQSGVVTTNLNAVGAKANSGFIAGETGVALKYTGEMFTSPMATIHSVTGDKSSAKGVDLLFGTQYFWRVRAKHSLDVSDWSGAQSFVTRATVTLEKPTDNQTNQNLNQLLDWKNQMSPFVTYEIQIDEDAAYGSPIFLATGSTEINAELLKFGVQYYWRVRAVHAMDASDWCASWKFTTINTVILSSPANEATDIKLSPVLAWTAQTGITGYNVELAKNNTFTSPLVSEMVTAEESSYIVPIILDKDAAYYWRVRAVNGLDTSGWSTVWSFRTQPPVGINEAPFSNKFNIYPNPADQVVYIQMKDNMDISFTLTLTDLVGKKVVEKQIRLDSGNKTTPVDVSGLQNGIYMLRISDNENIFTRKLIVKR